MRSEKTFFMRARSLVLALSIGICVDTAFAQTGLDGPTDDGKQPLLEGTATTSLPAITVRGYYDNAVGTSDAASQGVILGELLRNIPLLRPGEALETVPGLVVTQHSGDGKANQYFLRGYNLDHGTDFATSVDGVPVNMPTNAHGQGYSDVNFMMPELVDRINYRKGPYFPENGDFASAGSADIQYVKRLDHSIADLTIGGYGYWRALLAGSRTLTAPGQNPDSESAVVISGPTLLGALELQHANGPWTKPEQLRKTNALLRLSDGSKTKGWSVDGIYYDAKWYATDQAPLELIQSGQLGRFSAVDPYDGGDTGRNIVSGEWHNVDEAGYTKVAAYMQHYRLELWSNFTLFENNPVKGDQILQAENRNIVGGQAAKGWNHSLLEHDSTTELGLQLRHDNINVSLKNTEARVPYATITDDRVSETAVGLYMKNMTAWNPWLRTLIGLRTDHVAMDLTSYSQAHNSDSASGIRVSPKLSVILGPWEKTEGFINAGRGFHSNDARGATQKVDPSGMPVTAVPALVTSVGKEIGVRTEIIDGLQSSAALWSLNSASELVYSSTDGTTVPNGASTRYGVEWNNHWIANRWLMFDAEFAWTHARFANMDDNGATGNRIPNAVGRVALFRAAIHDLGPWAAGIETRYIGPYPLTQDGSLKAPSAIVTNLRVQREISKYLAVSLDALNVFNRKYFDIAYGQSYQVSASSPPVPSGITVHPGEPREFRLTLRLKF
jgi:hypothetical protein